MTSSLIFISGASRGIGEAMARTVPWDDARVIGINRSKPEAVTEHVELDLADPASWPLAGDLFRSEVAGFKGQRIAFIHAAGALAPIGFAGEVPTVSYVTNVLLNSASPQVLGHVFIEAVRDVTSAERHLVMFTSGAAKSVYPGWSSYGAAKAAVDQWVRDVGAEQDQRGGVRVLAVAPGTVDTGMQSQLRETSESDFPSRQKFVDLHAGGKLADPTDVARDIWSLLGKGLGNGTILDLRDLKK